MLFPVKESFNMFWKLNFEFLHVNALLTFILLETYVLYGLLIKALAYSTMCTFLFIYFNRINRFLCIVLAQ